MAKPVQTDSISKPKTQSGLKIRGIFRSEFGPPYAAYRLTVCEFLPPIGFIITGAALSCVLHPLPNTPFSRSLSAEVAFDIPARKPIIHEVNTP